MSEIQQIAGTVEFYDENDYEWEIFNDIIETPSLNFLNTWEIQYNQLDIHPLSCFVHWVMGAISDLSSYEFTKDQRKEITNLARQEDWANPIWGWYFQPAVKFVVKYFNETLNQEKDSWLSYYRLGRKDFEKALNKGYSIITGLYVSKWYSEDKNDDWIINFSKEHWGNWYWHQVRITKKQDSIYEIVVDNYYWVKKNNVYKLESLQGLIDEWRFFTNGYIVVIKKNVRDWYEMTNILDVIKKLSIRDVVKKVRDKLKV